MKPKLQICKWLLKLKCYGWETLRAASVNQRWVFLVHFFFVGEKSSPLYCSSLKR